ncbi:MAG: right-handed parallel beta-helix repeat-containing protein [Candidatus Cloacimonetes bacterium]|nr:right-handed parallel beta-helix repeat-containing protein [Candidatus Cloacimonadota bacterium]MBL7149047.1 right-handed parallel beta-helix repeat-containing protein [Candidatus Cloacimonadota bacterium]
MKKLLISSILTLFTISLIAIDVSGNQSGIWSPDNNPYNMIGEITVPAGETLEIQAGVELIAMGNYRITALGNILAEGTEIDSIRFHGNNGLNWGGIRLENETVQSTFNFCRISNTDDTNDYGIHSINSPVLINHSFIDDHQKAISFSALSTTTPSYMEIKNSKIVNVQKSGITIVDNSNVLIDSCEVTQCGLGTSFYGAIQLSLQNSAHDCSPTISNSYIHHNGKQGITMANLFNYNEMAPTVEYNEISFNYTGVYLYNGEGYYAHNYIHHNFVENDPNSGAGVMLYGSGANGTFTYNEITGNYTGFYLTDGATANLGDLENGSNDDDGFNMIHDNEFYTGEVFSVYNASALDVTAENNVWDINPAIEVTIIDGNDNPAYGIVDYEPYLPVLPPPDSITFNYQTNQLTIYPPTSPTYALLLSYNIYLDNTFIANTINNYFIIEPNPGSTILYGVSCVYDLGESIIIDTLITFPHILNPPTNVLVNLQTWLLTWEEPEPGSTSPFLHYNIYLDGDLYGTTNELFYQLTGLVNGQQYLVGLSAEYVAGESDILEFELPYVSSADDTIQMVSVLNNYPNPFNPTTTISFCLTAEDAENAELVIYNLKGQKVKVFVTFPNRGLGTREILWDGTDDSEKPVSSGVYFYKLTTGDKAFTRKMMLIK